MWRALKLWCAKHKLSMRRGHFSLKSLRSSNMSYPEISSKFKGEQAKTILYFLHAFVPKSDCDDYVRTRAAMLFGCVNMLHILCTARRFLTNDEAKDAISSGYLYLRSYQKLAAIHEAKRSYNYKIRPKMHYIDEMLMKLHEGDRTNPMHMCTAVDESYLGKCKRTGKLCHGITVPLRLLQRRALVVKLRQKRRLHIGRCSMAG